MRPTKYNKEMLNRAKEYVSGGYVADGDVVPSVAGMACYLDVSRSTVYNLANSNPEFLDIVSKCLGKQERLLLNGGLTGDYNASISKLLLAKHGYHDKVETDLKSSDGSMTPQAVSDTDKEIIQRYLDSCAKDKK